MNISARKRTRTVVQEGSVGMKYIDGHFETHQREQRWKSHSPQSKKGGKRMVAALIVVLSFSISIFLVVQFLFHTASWKEDRPFGIAVVAGSPSSAQKQITILWVDPLNQNVELLPIPSRLVVQTSAYGSYPVSSLYGLYALDRKPVEVFLHTLTRTLGIDLQGVIISSTTQPIDATSLPILLRQTLQGSSQTSLSWQERFVVWWYVRSHTNAIQQVSIPPTLITTTKLLSQDVMMLVLPDFDAWVTKTFPHDDISKEALTIAVVNASGVQRLASIAGREFITMGMNVLSIGDMTQIDDPGRIAVSSTQVFGSHTVKLLSTLTDLPVQVDSVATQQGRADIVIYLGKKEESKLIP